MALFFRDDSQIGARALQAYLVLIGLAWNRRTITYSELSHNRMQHYVDDGIDDSLLGCIRGWCYEDDLPPLAALIVNDATELPPHLPLTPSDFSPTKPHLYT